jgi:hypothetical protein
MKWEIGKQIWKREKCFIMTGGRGKGMEVDKIDNWMYMNMKK